MTNRIELSNQQGGEIAYLQLTGITLDTCEGLSIHDNTITPSATAVDITDYVSAA